MIFIWLRLKVAPPPPPPPAKDYIDIFLDRNERQQRTLPLEIFHF